jgi:hypothetical protein
VSGRRPIAAVCLAASFFAVIAGSGMATGANLQPLDLRVDGGEEAWHATPSFTLRWRNPTGDPPVAAVHYRLLSPSGEALLADTRIAWAASSLEGLHVPPVPGAYTAEIWLEDAGHQIGAPVSAQLRFDRTPPGKVESLSSSNWIGRTAFPYTLRLSHPEGPEPLSGIRGYAVSIDRSANGSPCADRNVCKEPELDLHSGASVDSLPIEDLPEGTSYVHAVAVSGSGMRSTVVGTSTLRVDTTDPVTRISGAPEGWSNRPVTLTALASDTGSGLVAGRSGPAPMTAIRIDDRPPVTAPGATAETTVIASGLHDVAYYARDAAGNVPDGGSANGEQNRQPAHALVKVDRDAPELAFANAQDARDPERIAASAFDSLAGIDPSRGLISVRRVGSREAFKGLKTWTADGLLLANWDSDAFPAGEYEFRAVAYDRAGNETTAALRRNGTAMLLHSPLKASTQIVAGFGDDGAQSRTVPFGHGASIEGHLIVGRRAPLAGAAVQVIERFGPGAEPNERTTVVTTSEKGDFSLRLRPGPNRQVFVLAPATSILRSASAGPLALSVRGGLQLGVSATTAKVGGAPIVFSGAVAPGGTTIPAEGKAVQLQFRLPGLPWREFRTIRTNRRGRFHYSYRFADDDSRGVRFQFRAFAPAQAGWPFEPAGSRPVAVLGR